MRDEQELILDGFKSYPVRTTITGWDASFNAITGLNGSGPYLRLLADGISGERPCLSDDRR